MPHFRTLDIGYDYQGMGSTQDADTNDGTVTPDAGGNQLGTVQRDVKLALLLPAVQA